MAKHVVQAELCEPPLQGSAQSFTKQSHPLAKQAAHGWVRPRDDWRQAINPEGLLLQTASSMVMSPWWLARIA
jgi:hypothetical protein